MKNQTSNENLPNPTTTDRIKLACNIARAVAPAVIVTVAAVIIAKKLEKQETSN